jgi:hypothetical protein
MSDEIDKAYEPDEPEKAFVNSDAHSFNGTELQPYTPSRIVAAQAMGLRYPNIGEEALEQFNRTGIYPSALLDTLIVLWLCTLDEPHPNGPGAAQVRRAMRRPDESIEKAIAWGADHGITDQRSENFRQAYDEFAAIVVEVQNSRSLPTEEHGAASGPEGPTPRRGSTEHGAEKKT